MQTRRHRPGLSPGRRRHLAARRRLDAARAREGLRHAAQQGADPGRHRHPAGAEFELVAVDDPYGYASAGELSLFRRPLPRPTCASSARSCGTAARRCATPPRPLACSTRPRASRRCPPTSPTRRTPRRSVTPRARRRSRRAAPGDRRLRAGPLHRAAAGRPRRPALASTARTAARRFLSRLVVLRHQRHAGRRLPHARRFTPTVMSLYQGWQSYLEDAAVPTRSGAIAASPSRGGRSRAARRSSTASRS